MSLAEVQDQIRPFLLTQISQMVVADRLCQVLSTYKTSKLCRIGSTRRVAPLLSQLLSRSPDSFGGRRFFKIFSPYRSHNCFRCASPTSKVWIQSILNCFLELTRGVDALPRNPPCLKSDLRRCPTRLPLNPGSIE